MDNQPPIQNQDLSQSRQTGIPESEVIAMKNKTIHDLQEYARTGVKTRRVTKPQENGTQSTFDWWDKVTTYEGDNWSISYSNYDNGEWELEVTKVAALPNGRSHSTSYHIRPENYGKFPGFQVYKEGVDSSYRQAKIEEIVYLNRVVQGLIQQVPSLN